MIPIKFDKILHGGDYNPEQWKSTPEIWDEDLRIFKFAGINSVSVGIFSWASYEPREGEYDFSWLDTIVDKYSKAGFDIILSTPSAAFPAWMLQKYPEIIRTDNQGMQRLFGGRQNHCPTSPVYREKVAQINRILALRYGKNPSIKLWHISNEYYAHECHCELCKACFRVWLKDKYKTLDNLNFQWWNAFWSHTITDWEQINPPTTIGENEISALHIDWRRFVSDQYISFFENEIAPLREVTPNIPVTHNMMGGFWPLNYTKLANLVDIISWDDYPFWHSVSEDGTAEWMAFWNDYFRGLKDGQPFMLMESTPSNVNWHTTNKLKRPGMLRLSAMHTISQGSDSIQYFQLRKSRGSHEKFHGAVIDHVGHENTRTTREVAQLGADLKKIADVANTRIKADVAVLYDWDSNVAINFIAGFSHSIKNYQSMCHNYHKPFVKKGIAADVISLLSDFSKYKIVIAPMLYSVTSETAAKIKDYVAGGGIFISTYLTGYVNENDLVYLGGFPGAGLDEVFGIWNEEMDSLYPHDANTVSYGGKKYEIKENCEIIHANGAEILATYDNDFYMGKPAVTKNAYRKGLAYYVAFRNESDFPVDFINGIIEETGLKNPLDTDLPKGVLLSKRGDFIFVMNYNKNEIMIDLKREYTDLLTGKTVSGETSVEVFGVMVLI